MLTDSFRSRNRYNRDKIIVFGFLIIVLVLRYILVPEHASVFSSIYLLWGIVSFVSAIINFLEVTEQDNKVLGKPWLLGLLLVFGIYVAYNFIVHGLTLMGWRNFLRTIESFWPSLFFIWISSQYEFKDIMRLVSSVVKWLNIYFWCSFPLLVAEHSTGTFMVSRFTTNNAYLSDQVTGLIGFNGTAIMCLYWISLLFGNYLIYKIYKSRMRLVLLLSEFFVMTFVAQYFSEIKNFIPTTIVSILVLLMMQIRRETFLKSLKDIGVGLGVFVVLIYCIYTFSSSMRDLIDHFILLYTQLRIDPSNGSDIRIHTFWVASGQLRNLGFSGINFGTQHIFPQLDVISLNALMVYGGVILTILTILVSAQFLSMIVNQGVKESFVWTNISFVVYMIYMCIISVPYQDSRFFLFIYLMALLDHCIISEKQIVVHKAEAAV